MWENPDYFSGRKIVIHILARILQLCPAVSIIADM